MKLLYNNYLSFFSPLFLAKFDSYNPLGDKPSASLILMELNHEFLAMNRRTKQLEGWPMLISTQECGL